MSVVNTKGAVIIGDSTVDTYLKYVLSKQQMVLDWHFQMRYYTYSQQEGLQNWKVKVEYAKKSFITKFTLKKTSGRSSLK